MRTTGGKDKQEDAMQNLMELIQLLCSYKVTYLKFLLFNYLQNSKTNDQVY
jgi:hypothetical protein